MTQTILILAANPTDTLPLRLDHEVREIDNALRRALMRDAFILRQQWAAREKDVRRAMLELQPSIVHFCGHGEGSKGIAFEDDAGHTKLVTAEALKNFFAQFADHVECVLLNACYSETQAEAIAEHIEYVVGMKEGIADKAAIEFAVAFYDGLGAGKSIEFAFRLACNAIQWAGLPQHLTPVLKSKSDISLQQKTSYSSNEFEQQLFCDIEDEIFSIAFSEDKKWLAVGSEEKVLLWDILDGEYLLREEANAVLSHPDYVYTIAFSPDSKLLVTAGQDKIVRMWNIETQSLLWEQDEQGSRTHTDAVYSVIFSPDGKYILTGSYDNSVKMWNASTGNWMKEFRVSGRVSCVAHAPSGKEPSIAIASHDNSITLWNPKTGRSDVLTGSGCHRSSVESIVFSPNGLWLASCGLDKAVVLWDVEKRCSVWRREGNQYHQYLVKSIAISPDGETLASASWDKKINLWDVEGNHYQELPYSASPWHEDWIWSVAFSADGKVLASGGSDGSVMIWRHKIHEMR